MKLPNNEYTIDKKTIPPLTDWRSYMDVVETVKDQAYYPEVSAALPIAIRGIEEDEKENYHEALKLYQESRQHLERSLKLITSVDTKKLVRRKLNKLIDRIFVLKIHIIPEIRSSPLANYRPFFRFRALLGKAIDKDDSGNYKEALRLYGKTKKPLLQTIKYQAFRGVSNERCCKKLKDLTARAKKLEAILERERITIKMRQLTCTRNN